MTSLNTKILFVCITLCFVGLGIGAYMKYSARDQSATAREEASLPSILTETDWDDYIFPTDAGHTMTSNFAEFRSNHFHAGIDISTGMREGFNVFAMRDGWLHSVLFEPGGYGWFIVLRHADGYYTTSAHLKGFPKKILDAYRKELLRQGKSYGKVIFERNAVPVKKGEVIAFTGATGAGPPHLHYEIRDSSFNPVNPQLAKNLRIKDTIAPVIQSIFLQPLDATSSVNGKKERCFLPIQGKNAGAPMPVLKGRIGFYVKGYDRAEEAQDSYTPYKYELFINGVKYFDVTYDRIQDSLYWHIRIDREHALMRAQKGEYRKLFREAGNRLSVYMPNIADAGVLSQRALGSGKRTWKIIASDIKGNKSVVEGSFILAQAQQFIAQKDEASNIRLELAEPIEAASLDVEGRTNANVWENVKSYRANELGTLIGLSHVDPRYALLRITSTDSMHVPSFPVFIAMHELPDGEMLIDRRIELDEIIYTITSNAIFTLKPEVVAEVSGKKIFATVVAESPSKYVAVLKAVEGFNPGTRIGIHAEIGGMKKQRDDYVQAYFISAAKGGRAASDDGTFTIYFHPYDVTNSMLCSVTKFVSDSARGYSVFPQEIPIAGTPRVDFLLDNQAMSASKYFIRALHPGISMRYNVARVNAESKSISARFGYFLANYVLSRDESVPSIDVNLSRRKSAGCQFRVSDAGSGVDMQSVKVWIDAKLIPVEFREGGKYFVIPPEVFPRGAKEIKIQISDRVGNTGSVVRMWK